MKYHLFFNQKSDSLGTVHISSSSHLIRAQIVEITLDHEKYSCFKTRNLYGRLLNEVNDIAFHI
jgi:hypothetical protein